MNRRIIAGGVALSVSDSGARGAKTPTLVFLHFFGGSQSHESGYSVDDNIDDIAAFLEELKVER